MRCNLRLHGQMPELRSVARNVLRGAIIVAAIISIVRGNILYGLFCLAALGITTMLSRRVKRSPIEIELVLLMIMVLDMTLGHALGLYRLLPWYDKALHLGSSIVIGLLGFLAIYAVHVTGQIKVHPWIDGVAILLVTLGLGAIWEIGEYGVDSLLGLTTQSSPRLDAIDDTMLDLIIDAIGGVVAAIFGPIYMRRSRSGRQRVGALGARWLAH
jgi:hypothetical protein